MKNAFLFVVLTAAATAAFAQTAATPAAPAKRATAAKPAVKPIATSVKTETANDILPPGAPVFKAEKKTLYTVALRYQDEKIGDGALAEPGKLLKYNFTLWTAGANGVKLDSSYDHRTPVLDKDKKPVMDADGKPKMGDPQPAAMIMGQGRPLPGWDQGFAGMKVGGTRRIFIPWQLGLGDHEIPARDATHPAIPAKSDMVLDVELIDVADAPKQPQRPAMGAGMHPPMGAAPHPMPAPPAAATPAPAPTAPAAAAPAPAPAAPAAATPASAAPAKPVQPQSK